MLSPSILKVSSYVVLPKNNRKGMVCATFSMLKQAKSKVDFIETMWQKNKPKAIALGLGFGVWKANFVNIYSTTTLNFPQYS